MIVANYLKMDGDAIEKEINRQKRKIAMAEDNISLLKRLQETAVKKGQEKTPQIKH